jgi:hypothetical protein
MSASPYQGLLERAGAKVLAFDYFGDYQGTWVAKVEHAGVVKWVIGAYGSCSGCDAFEAEFGSGYHDHGDEFHNSYDDKFPHAGCAECAAIVERMAKAGANYLTNAHTYDEALAEVERQCSDPDWVDEDDKLLLQFLKANA